MTLKTIFTSFFLSLSLLSLGQKTAALNEPERSYKSAVELYNKQLYNQAINLFNDVQADIKEPNTQAEIAYYIASSKLYLKHQNALNVMLDFQNKYPNHFRVNHSHLELGDYYFEQNQIKPALQSYKKIDATGLKPSEKDRMLYRLGVCYIKTNKYKEAKETLAPLTNSDNPYKTEATYYYGYACYQEKDYNNALTAFLKVQDSKLGAVRLYIAEIYYLQNNYQQSIDFAANENFGALNKNKNMLMGKCYYRLNNYSKALEFFEAAQYNINELNRAEAYEIGFAYFSTQNCIRSSELFEKIANTGDAMAQSASYHLGDCFLKNGKKQNAFNAFYEAQRTEFDKTIQEEALFAYAKLAHELGFNSKAVAAYQKFNELFPNSSHRSESKRNLATLLYSSNDFKMAIQVLDDMNGIDESSKDLFQKLLLLRAKELYLQKDFLAAEPMFKRSMQVIQNNEIAAEANFWLGEMYYNRVQYPSARSYYQLYLDYAEGKKLKQYPDALYAVAYTFYKEQKYNEAANYFNKYKNSVGYTLPENMFHDATLRLGDCYFAINNYNGAIDAYTYIISNKKPGADYAMFQQSMIFGLQSKATSKIVGLKKLVADYPNSPFVPEAMYQTGDVYLSIDNDQEAEQLFKALIQKYPNSKWVKSSWVKLAAIQYSRNNYSEAMELYHFIAQTYSGTPEAQKAIKNAEIVAKKQGNIKSYLDWVKTLPNVNISTSKEDSLYYDAALRQYRNEKYAAAQQEFKQYLNQFSNGFFTVQANYYLAYSCLFLKDTQQALPYFSKTLAAPAFEFKEDVANQMTNVYSKKSDCVNGFQYYELLEKYSTNPINSRKAVYHQLLCLNTNKDYTQSKTKAEQLLKYEQITNAEKGEANNSLARAYLHDSLYKVAAVYIAKTLKNQQDIYAAEAKYYEAYSRLMQDSLDKCKKSIMEFNNQFNNYDYWLGKTFILLSDFYLKKGDEFQAKATLNSVLDQFENPEIVAIAQEKLKWLENKNNPPVTTEGN